MAKLNEIEGIGETFAGKLAGAGVKSTDDLLEKCSTPAGRKEVAEASGVGEKTDPQVGQHGRPVPHQGRR